METIFYLAVAHFFALLIPGPDFALVMATSISSTRSGGIMASFGIASGLSLSALGAAFVLPLCLASLPQIIWLVQWVGAFYLLYLSYQAFQFSASGKAVEIQMKSLWVKGFLCNATNPKALLFFLSIFSVAATHLSFEEKCLIVMILFVMTFGYFTLLAYTLSEPRLLQKLGNLPDLQAKATRLSAYIFLLFSILMIGKILFG